MNTQLLGAKEFATLYQQNKELFVVDLRTAAEFSGECLHDCVHLPVQELTTEGLEAELKRKGLDKDTPIYLLCQSGRRANMAVEKLQHTGNFNFVILDGGLNAIKQHGMQTHSSGKKVIPLERQVRITAGLLILLATTLGFAFHPGFFLIAAFVGAGLTYAGLTDHCGIAFVLTRMPWNK